MDEFAKLQAVCNGFEIPGTFYSYEQMRSGHLHNTYRIEFSMPDGGKQAYTAQEINTYAFRKPIEVMENIDLVTRHIAEKHVDGKVIRFLHAHDGKPYLIRETQEGSGFWRIYNHIEAVTFNESDDVQLVRSTGSAFGSFMMDLADIDPLQLHYTIPDFHDTRKRYEQLEAALERDECGRAKEVREEVDYLESVKDLACTLTDLADRGEIPIRVTHNDTKINNVLFDEQTHEALAVIDLDTVMPGLAGHDFGDAIRFVANTVTEDCKKPELVHINTKVADAYADGFLEKTAAVLTDKEAETLSLSPFVLTAELSTRFLADYLDGDKYFHIDYPDHNLVRTRAQIALARDIHQKQQELDDIVAKYVEKYRR